MEPIAATVKKLIDSRYKHRIAQCPKCEQYYEITNGHQCAVSPSGDSPAIAAKEGK